MPRERAALECPERRSLGGMAHEKTIKSGKGKKQGKSLKEKRAQKNMKKAERAASQRAVQP
jgi:hypothetical protein